MISTINLHNLSQENVSCLNTTLVVLMLANRRQKLPQYLEAIQLKSMQIQHASELYSRSTLEASTTTSTGVGGATTQPVDTMTNFEVNISSLLIYLFENSL